MKDFETLNLVEKKESKTIIRKEIEADDKKFHDFMDKWGEFVDNQKEGMFEKIGKYEIEKSPEQKALLELIFSDINKTLNKYGLSEIGFSLKMVKLVEGSLFQEIGINDESIDGKFDWITQTVFIKNQECGLTNSEFSAITYHELLHLVSFNRLQYSRDINEELGVPIFKERSGITIVNKETKKYKFDYLTEAIVQKLTRDFVKRERNNPLLKDDYDIVEKQYEGKNKQYIDSIRKVKNRDGEIIYNYSTAYENSVRSLEFMVEEIYEKNKEDFNSKELIFDVFVNALLTGKLLKLARLLEKTFGKGYFRKLANETER